MLKAKENSEVVTAAGDAGTAAWGYWWWWWWWWSISHTHVRARMRSLLLFGESARAAGGSIAVGRNAVTSSISGNVYTRVGDDVKRNTNRFNFQRCFSLAPLATEEAVRGCL